MSDYYIGQIFENNYPSEAAYWCNDSQSGDNPCRIVEIEPLEGVERFQIVANPQPTEEEVKLRRIDELQRFLNDTDWYCSRYVDIGTPIPDDIKQQRSEARIEIDRLRHELEPTTEPQLDDEPTSADEPTDQQ